MKWKSYNCWQQQVGEGQYYATLLLTPKKTDHYRTSFSFKGLQIVKMLRQHTVVVLKPVTVPHLLGFQHKLYVTFCE